MGTVGRVLGDCTGSRLKFGQLWALPHHHRVPPSPLFLFRSYPSLPFPRILHMFPHSPPHPSGVDFRHVWVLGSLHSLTRHVGILRVPGVSSSPSPDPPLSPTSRLSTPSLHLGQCEQLSCRWLIFCANRMPFGVFLQILG